MQRIGRLLLKIMEVLGLSILGTIVVAGIVALRHMITTPQPLESILPGEGRLYRWRQGHIFYKVLGAADAPPVVLLHTPGIGASAYEMRAIMEPLAQQYRVYAPDLLGFGLSDRPRLDYSAETYISWCHDFLTEVVARPATLAASRLSCNYAIAVARRFPDLCERLVLISPTALFGREQKPDLPTDLAQSSVVRSLLYPLVSTRPLLRYTAAREQHLNYDQVSGSDVDYLYATTHQFGAAYAPMAWLTGKLDLDVSQALETLQQPTLIIWGTQALNSTRAIASQQFIATSPNIRMVLIEDAGAGVHEEYPATVVADIREWGEAGKLAMESAHPGTSETLEVAPTPEVSTQVEELAVEPAEAEVLPAEQAEPVAANAEKASDQAVGESAIEGYCVKCKQKRKIRDPQEVILKNGRLAVQGTCEVCGTKVYRIGRL